MNIPSITTDGQVPPAKPKAQPTKASPARPAEDVFKPDQQQKLLNQIQSEPDVRPEVVARARLLAADSNYPSRDALEKIARALLSEDSEAKHSGKK
jgi:hypothetical protein